MDLVPVPASDEVATRPPFDPGLAAVLAAAGVPPTLLPEMVPAIRQAHRASRMTDDAIGAGRDVVVEHVTIARDDVVDLELLVCRPRVQPPTAAPGVLWMHAGGMVTGHERTGLGIPLRWMDDHAAVLVSVDYRLAPEHPHPAALQDCLDAYRWLVDNASILGVDPARLVLAGYSAGGGLCANLCLMLRDQDLHRPAAALLLSPMLDQRNTTVSSRQFDGIGVWDRTSNETGWNAYLPGRPAGDEPGEYAAAATAGDVSALPPAYLDVGSAEVFRDETTAFASRVWSAGGDLELHVWAGGFHGFESIAPDQDLSVSAASARSQWLGRTLARS